MSKVPVWAQAESEQVRRFWVEVWGLLEEASAMAREVARRPDVLGADYEIADYEATVLADRIDAFLRGATADPPVSLSERPSCGNCGAILLGEHPTRCQLCGQPQFKAVT